MDTQVDEAWRDRPPYRPVDREETSAFERKHEGRCHCGRVRYWLRREKPIIAKYCHCRGCQVLHGRPGPPEASLARQWFFLY